jgi:hypothetical protein
MQLRAEAEYKKQNFPLPRNGKRCSPLSCDWAVWQVPGLSSVANVRQDFRLLKGSRQPERRGARNVSNDPNLSRTAAIEVLFSINFTVVLDFIYFRFRPSKLK